MKSRLTSFALLAAALAIAGGLLFHLDREAEESQPDAVLSPQAGGEPVLPLPQTLPLDPAKVALGEALFHEPLLSHDNTLSCASCHDLAKGGADGRARSVGIRGQMGALNAPTVFNSGFNFVQFWDGRADSLEEQAAGPIHNPVEMGSDWMEAVDKLKATRHYPRLFTALYPGGISAAAVQDALATFERSLYTPDSRFDRYLRGETAALSAQEQEGYRLFKSYGCASCHQGMNIGGNMFQRFGVMDDYFAARGHPNEGDLGRYNVTGDEADRHVFKVPGLRNVALTAPYFHDGSAPDLESAVATMGKFQLGRTLSDEETGLIVRFLRTLTGTYKGQPL